MAKTKKSQIAKPAGTIFPRIRRRRMLALEKIQEVSANLVGYEADAYKELMDPDREVCSPEILRFIEKHNIVEALIVNGIFNKTIDIRFADYGFKTKAQFNKEFRNLYSVWSGAVYIKIESTFKNIFELEMRTAG